jgi:aspartokinase/homoserine dehydrogenase 1
MCVADGLTAERSDHDLAGGVELKTFKADHPFGTLNGSDNMVCFTTKRYCSTPLVVRGPGAGAEVTAGGVFGDLLKLAAYLGAPS